MPCNSIHCGKKISIFVKKQNRTTGIPADQSNVEIETANALLGLHCLKKRQTDDDLQTAEV